MSATDIPTIIKNKYRITHRIGGGSFGEIYEGIGPNGVRVAVKLEKKETNHPQLRHEYKVYRELEGAQGFCRVRFCIFYRVNLSEIFFFFFRFIRTRNTKHTILW
jgi:predicted Ser/Thr protein kinase